VALADFDSVVQNCPDDWVADNLHVKSACVTIASCITQYSNAALKLYPCNPEHQSIMILNTFELWVGLDKLAVAQCSLLQEYSPEDPQGLLEPLLIRRSKLFKRLTFVEKYLRERHYRAHSKRSIFSDDVDAHTFAVSYFNTSVEHQHLQMRIEDNAKSERQEKIRELHSQNNSHQDLVRRYETLAHKNEVLAMFIGEAGSLHGYHSPRVALTARSPTSQNHSI
jgi:hypothetical protein